MPTESRDPLTRMWLVRVGQGLLGVFALAVSQLAGMDLPRGFWVGRAWVVYAAVAVLALSAGAEPLWEGVRLRLRRHRDLRQRDLDVILRATLLRLDEAGLDWREVGIHAFFAAQGFWGERLVRVGRLRMSLRPASHPRVRWTKGKGVIGRCWATGRYVVVNVAPLYREHAQMGPAEWDAQPAEKRMGMTHAEMQATREYGGGAIAAGPVLDPDGRFHGCVAVDAPEGNYKRLREPAVQQAVQDACTSLWALTRARVGWVGQAAV